MKKKTITKCRNFATVVYPDSVNTPENWLEILSSFCVPAFAIMHDKDINPDGSIKKTHYHVMVMFEGPKTSEQVSKLFDKIGGVGLEVINSLRGYARYLTHMDNPEKHRYSSQDVLSFCGADYDEIIGLPSDKYKVLKEMISWIKESRCYSFSELIDYSAVYRDDWFRVLSDSGTVMIKEYLKSAHWTARVSSLKDKEDYFRKKYLGEKEQG